jgi:predicted Zn-dependent protease
LSLQLLKRINLKRSFFKRAILWVALFFQATSLASQAGKTESYQDIIGKAQNLILQQDRKQAQNLLLAALKKEKKPVAIEAVRQSLRDLSQTFLSDKAQQLYEASSAAFFTDAAASQNSLNEAKKIEPENTEIRQLDLLHFLRANQCEAAQAEIEKISHLLPHFEEFRLIKARKDLCLGSFAAVESALSNIDKKSPHLRFWTSLAMELHFRRGQFSKAVEALASQSAQDPLPELTYWRFKSELEMKNKVETLGQKYLSVCKNIGPRQRREFLLEPHLCSRVQEVESFLKKVNNPEI